MSLCSIIENTNGQLFLHPGPDGDTYVNGKVMRRFFELVVHVEADDVTLSFQRVCKRLKMKNGDRLIIGGSHYFKVIHPIEQDDTANLTEPVEFDFAHQEVLRVQENE